jgi:biopolymer transport protein ExbD
MAFTSFNAGAGMQPMSEINTTPLVDVMLVLLVIFIITAPLFHQAVPVDLPKVDSSKLDEKPKVVQLAIDAEGRIFVDGAVVEAARLGATLSQRVRAGETAPELHLRADRSTRYEKVTEVMAKAQQAGMTKIAFVTSGDTKVAP